MAIETNQIVDLLFFRALTRSLRKSADLKMSIVLLGGELIFIKRLSAMGHGDNPAPRKKSSPKSLVRRLPLKTQFRTSRLYISVIPPILVGTLVGILSAIMGVDGGFMMVSAMIIF